MFNFNLLNPMVQMVSGYQRRNRKTSICVPKSMESQRTADQLTKCLFYVNDNSNGYSIYSDAFEQGSLTQGMGLISVYMDYSTDPVNGEIKQRYIDFKSVILDPYFRKSDLSDCRFIHTRQFFDQQELALLYSKFSDEILSMSPGGYQDDKFYYMPEVYQIQFPNLMAMDEYWYLATREVEYLVDTQTNEMQEFKGDEEDLRHAKFMYGDRFKLVKKPRQTVRRTLLINDRVLVDEPNPYGLDRYPFAPSLGYFTPDTAYYSYKFRGMIRDARDSQYLFNRRKVTDLEILESQQQGLKVKKGALVTPDDALNQGNGRILTISEKAQMTDVEQMQIIPPSPVMLQMEDMLKQTLREITGVNEELLGAAVDDKAGILAVLRQGAGLTTLQTLFDRCDDMQKQCGEIIVEMVQKNWTYNKVKDILGEDPTPEFDDKAFFKYGCKVVQGSMTETQQQLEFQQLLYMYELTGSSNPALLERALEVSTIQEKDKLLEKMAQQQKGQQEEQQKMQEIQMQQIKVDMETKMAYAEDKRAEAVESIAKSQTDRAKAEAELSRAETEDAEGLLALVKAVKELQGLDTANLMNKISVLQQINELDFDKKKEILQETASVT